jgi:hypothetical protein
MVVLAATISTLATVIGAIGFSLAHPISAKTNVKHRGIETFIE